MTEGFGLGIKTDEQAFVLESSYQLTPGTNIKWRGKIKGRRHAFWL